ncbi:hypothetical protein AB4Z46_31365 [Variovorax sp. M-6]|uniref:hypothetical protein n=1 Tax=Variovorax sp. M-6 TaxID=3233041 RepID=UPI003F99266B
MATSTSLQDSAHRLPSISEDIERELAGPARQRVLGEFLSASHYLQLKEVLSAAVAALPQPDRILFEARAWEKAIHRLQTDPGLDAQARKRVAEDVISSYVRAVPRPAVQGDRNVNAESLC